MAAKSGGIFIGLGWLFLSYYLEPKMALGSTAWLVFTAGCWMVGLTVAFWPSSPHTKWLVGSAGLILVMTLGDIEELPIAVTISIAFATFIALSIGVSELQERDRRPRDRSPDESLERERLERARDRIQEIADGINASGIEVVPAIQIGAPDDWKAESKSQLRGIVNDKVYKHYLVQLRSEYPEREAKRFLEALADTLSTSQLRND